ncbi:right-handed parallel beta-helix repeat-containing protein [Pontibacter qinzhouensis]|uniref:Right-handed parallel beta-helix repeat-containing protein n=1 Tax=Pontibacter qinzhouensis TaxID=2603253 RepID=A0A5C8KCW9_9BACT|nr:right-handed parallel beta-helix repeat-containing protein [Pontibacter qinzhouensis]TXK49350.1 right-handed parallel beta-helix repeat-containing protein [Pontibacter qinzhouensis]
MNYKFNKASSRIMVGLFLLFMVGSCSSIDEDLVQQEMQQIKASTQSASGEVKLIDDTWHSYTYGVEVYVGTDMITAIQQAIDRLNPNRREKELVVVHHSGNSGPDNGSGDVHGVYLRNFTALDFLNNTMHVNDTDRELIVPIIARRAHNIEIRNFKITGNPRYGIWIQSSENVIINGINISIPEAKDVGLGIRIDNGRGTRSKNVAIDNIYVEKAKNHGVETAGVDSLTIGKITTVDTGGCGLLLNGTKDAVVDLVHATRANKGGGYAGFRTANDCGPNILVKKVIASECGRGVFSVSGSYGITIEEVDISGSTSQGVLIENTQDYTIKRGVIKNSGNQGLRIASRNDGTYHPSRNVMVRNLRIYDDRTPMIQTHGILETAPSSHNRIVNNDLRNSGTQSSLEYHGEKTIAAGNRVDK